MTLADILLSLLGTPPVEPEPLPDRSSGESRLLIDGELVMGAEGHLLEDINPADGTIAGTVADATMPDAQRAVEAARRAFDSGDWADDVELRRRCLRQLQDGLRAEAPAFRAALIEEIGCARRMTYADQYDYAVEKLGFFTDLIATMEWERDLPDEIQPGARVERSIAKVPLGVVSAITPWNLPLELILAKVGGALAAGCTMIVKPSPLSPWAGTMLGRIISEHTDIPPGVVNILISSDMDVATYLTRAPEIDAIAFTGSTATGRAVMAAAADGLKRVSLELGGKSASIVLDDLDIEQTVPVIAGMACFNAGQSCIMPSRILVPRSRYHEAIEAARFGLESVRVGDPRSLDTFMGPLISEAQRIRVEDLLERGLAGGGDIAFGGQRLDSADGYYFEPTLVVDLPETSPLLQEEVFGPVIAMIPYHDEADAIRIANDTEFGLAGYVWSASTDSARSIARRLRTGMLGINGGMFTGADMPFGGRRSSGMGREWGVEGLEEFLDVQTLALRIQNGY